MNVLYLCQGWIDRISKTNSEETKWYLARAILHEANHKMLGTVDFAYLGPEGLHPNTLFPVSKAIRNADSWTCLGMEIADLPTESGQAVGREDEDEDPASRDQAAEHTSPKRTVIRTTKDGVRVQHGKTA